MYGAYYEDDTQPRSHKSPRKQPARKPADELIPGTDAWIEAQAAQKRTVKQPKKRARKRKSKAAQTRSKSPEALEPGQIYESREQSATEDANMLANEQWIFEFYTDNLTVAVKPPETVTLRSWEVLHVWLPQPSLFSIELELRIEPLRNRLAWRKKMQEAQSEITEALVVRLPTAQINPLWVIIKIRLGNDDT
ncbi:MAG: hypothetical protein Q9188_003272 [Gyalolechia gomerana]